MSFASAKSALVVWLRPLGLLGLTSDLDLDTLFVDVLTVHVVDSLLD